MTDSQRLVAAIGRALNAPAAEPLPGGTLVDIGGELAELAPELARSFAMEYTSLTASEAVGRNIPGAIVALGGASATSSSSVAFARSLAIELDAPLVVVAANSGFWPNALGALLGLERVMPPVLGDVTRGDLDAAMVTHDLGYAQTEDLREPDEVLEQTLTLGVAPTSPLNALLRAVRSQSDDTAETSYFVRRIAVGAAGTPSFHDRRPFLSVVMRSQGRREQAMREVFTCLEAQTDQDFEIVVVPHNANALELETIHRVVGDCSVGLRRRIRIIEARGGLRSLPLNVGFSAAQGRYIASLDDDDSVLGHWVETFRKGSEASPGAIIRTISLKQEVDMIAVAQRDAVRAGGAPTNPYPATFDFVDHLVGSNTPFHCYGFPAEAFHALGFRFDEDLSLQEDWDFAMRVGTVCGVYSVPEVTAIYRWWVNAESSRTQVNEYEVHRNHQHIREKFNEQPLLLPAGSEQAIWGYAFGPDRRVQALAEAQAMLGARGWRATAPLRRIARAVVKNTARYPMPHEIVYWSTAELGRLMHDMRLSVWRRGATAARRPLRTAARALTRKVRPPVVDLGLRWDVIDTKSSWDGAVLIHRRPTADGEIDFGSELVAAIITRVFELEVRWAELDSCDLLVSGTDLEMAMKEPVGNTPAVWGAGYMRLGSQVIEWDRFRFAAVRGRLTLERINVPWGESVAIGEPALLASVLVPNRPAKRFRLGVVPHSTDRGHPLIDELSALGEEVQVIQLEGTPETVVDLVAQCDAVLSSSLFPLVIADSLQIPNAHLVLRNVIKGGDYGFEDYYSGFQQARYSPLSADDLRGRTLEAVVDQVKSHHAPIVKLTEIQTDLVNSFPFRERETPEGAPIAPGAASGPSAIGTNPESTPD